jgi:hypothetical protein
VRELRRQGSRGWRCCILAASVAGALAWAQPAPASSDQESILQDDPRIVYADSDARIDEVMATLKSIGVDRVRVSVFWNLVVPNPGSDPASPRAYPPETWDRFDRIVTAARQHGLGAFCSRPRAPPRRGGPGPAPPDTWSISRARKRLATS